MKVLPLVLPKILFGTSSLGNLYTVPTDAAKLELVKECIKQSVSVPVFDSAGKYGAGLALETLGSCLTSLKVNANDVLISNKLGWLRKPLITEEPTFEPGIWKNIRFDAVQKISYDGILECFEEGNKLLKNYSAQLVSVHDPDEYLAAASDAMDADKRYQDILEAYRALFMLKAEGKVQAVGIGSKDWRVIERIANDVALDWVMLAGCMTIKTHSTKLIRFMETLCAREVLIINSAVFNAGFLTGGQYYNYKSVTQDNETDRSLLSWRSKFFEACDQYNVKPAEACVQFSAVAPGVKSVALNTTHPARVAENVRLISCRIPSDFWKALLTQNLIDRAYEPYLSN